LSISSIDPLSPALSWRERGYGFFCRGSDSEYILLLTLSPALSRRERGYGFFAEAQIRSISCC
jgi:hypothetical protein